VHQYVDPRRSSVVTTAPRAPVKPLRVERTKRIMRSSASLQPQLRPRPTCVHRILVLPHTRSHQRSIRDLICRPVIAGSSDQIFRRNPSVTLRHLNLPYQQEAKFNTTTDPICCQIPAENSPLSPISDPIFSPILNSSPVASPNSLHRL
jgi:hypothetical protein